ncbi:von Willebrand factor A domain-containing protein 5A-like isoform X3 [Aquarana catesbeiana]|uniref:von Willebrand factor A domain-containing protein 5A-like isoform X3 n=1 Tax=Aquarana catesbeiana TaxID=8400 RepID=UPI003CC9388B
MPPFPPCCGLIIVASRQPVPLQGIWVDVQVKGFVADVSATLKYKNKEEKAVEAVFVFPMDEDSAVYSFEATIEGKTIVADLQEKEQAHKTYDEAIRQGKQAFLLEEDESSADIFSCSVGNLPPGQEAEVTLKYVRELPVEADGAVRFVLPAVLNPRYTPKDHDVSITATRPQVPIGEIPYTLSLNAQFQSAYGIAKIESNCNITPLEYTDSDRTSAKVSLAEGHKFERDVELLAYYMDVNKPSVTVEAGLGATDAAHESGPTPSGSIMAESVAMLSFYPSFPAGQEQSNCGEFIFLVDRSGSMQCSMNSESNAPQRIQSARETLVLLLKSLPLGCYFNIYGFGSHFEAFFPESVEYTQQSMEEAVKKVNVMDARFGGTEILQPLKKIYQTAGRAEHPRQLFVFTDGEVGNTKQVINKVQRNSKKHRCFTFGIGEGASTSLIKGMARAGSGTFEFITGKDRMQPKVLRALKCSLQPSVKDISLKWTLPSSVEAIVLSKVPTAIFHGQRSIVYAQLKGKVENEADGQVCLQYKFKDEIIKNDLRFPLKVQNAERPTIHRLAAKTLISELDHGTESPSEDVKKILETSLQSGVVSSLTAYVAVNKDTKTHVEGPPMRRDVPAPAFTMACSAPMQQMACARSCMPQTSVLMGSADMAWDGFCMPQTSDFDRDDMIYEHGGRSSKRRKAQRSCSPDTSDSECDRMAYEDVEDEEIIPSSPVQKETPALVRLITVQNADGSWKLTPEISAVLGISEADIKTGNPDQNVEVSVWVTVLAVIWLHTTCVDQREEWELLERKAVSWVKAKAGSFLGEFVRAGNELLNSSVEQKVFGL